MQQGQFAERDDWLFSQFPQNVIVVELVAVCRQKRNSYRKTRSG